MSVKTEEEVVSGDETEVSLEEQDMMKKKQRKPYTLTEEGKAVRLRNLAKAKEKQKALQEEKDKKKYEELKAKYEAKPVEDETEEPQQEENVVLKTTHTKPNGKKKVKKVVYEEDSDSSSDEEIIVRKKKGRGRRAFTEEELRELREEEIQRRLKLHEERDEFAKLEKEALKRRYAEKLKEAKMTQFNSFMFPESSFRRR